MACIGYAHVSSSGQSVAVQLDKLSVCDKTYQEKKSGSRGQRPTLNACLEYVRQGDTLVVTRLDRLARSTLHLCQIVAELERKEVDLQVLDQQIDTRSSTGRLLFHMLAAIAQFETDIRAEWQRDGIAHAKARGVPFGRHKTLTRAQTAALRAQRQQGAPIRLLMRDFRLFKATVYRYLGQSEPDEATSTDASS